MPAFPRPKNIPTSALINLCAFMTRLTQGSDMTTPTLHGTTILCVRKDGQTVMAGDGQVTFDVTVFKKNARKIRRLYDDKVIAGFAGATADAFTLFEHFECLLHYALRLQNKHNPLDIDPTIYYQLHWKQNWQ